MNSLELATTFPEAKPVLKRLIMDDRQKIKLYNDKMTKVRSWLATHQGTLFGTRNEDLIGCMIAKFKQHIVKQGATFNQVLTSEDRLKVNQAVLGLIERQGHPGALNWMDRINEAKSYPIIHLLEFNRSGKAKCIWHNERTPSLHYYPKTNTVHCFACNRSDDSIGIVRHLKNLSFKEAVQWLTSSR